MLEWASADGKLGIVDSSPTNTRKWILLITGMSLEEDPESRRKHSQPATTLISAEEENPDTPSWISEMTNAS